MASKKSVALILLALVDCSKGSASAPPETNKSAAAEQSGEWLKGDNLPLEQVEPAVALQRIAACGFQNVRLWDELKSGKVVFIGGEGPESWKDRQRYLVEVDDQSASAAQLACAARVSLRTWYKLRLASQLRGPYNASYKQVYEDELQTQARALLERRGVVSHVPKYRAGAKMLDFARSLEPLCGPKARGVFVKNEDGSIDFDMVHLERMGLETLGCLQAAVIASGMPRANLVDDEPPASDVY